ncbi:hypothetical protein [Flavobacterium sp. 28YEA47A]|uniref:hypothetical protein n=1 Tax=Flavobacterium sp. 28YEA47A TaxID=3156276 RepID=UPI003516B2A3
MYLRKIATPKDVSEFLELPSKIYADDPNYIKPLDKDIEVIFDRNKNLLFRSGNCCRWLLLDEKHEVIGRIATFYNIDSQTGLPNGGIGFFECINAQKAANLLFDCAKEWLRNEGLKAMDGPINFGNRMNYWGLLIKGFQEPLYGMNYNPPYYQALFNNYGFQVSYHQYCYSIDLKAELPSKFYRIKDIIADDSSYELRPFNKTQLTKFAKDFTKIYNTSWAQHHENKMIEEEEVLKSFRKMKPVIDEKTIWFVYCNDEPIAFWINLPNLNDYFKYLGTRLGLFSILKFLWLKKFHPTKHLVGLIFGIVPKFQNKGVDAFLIVKALEIINAETQYDFYEVQWIGDFNPKMINVIQNMNGKITRTLATYNFSF